MATQLEEAARASGSTHRAGTLTPQARRLLEGPVLATLLRLAAPTVALMLLQGVIAAGEAAFVGRLGSHALAGVSLSFPLVMLMTTLSAGAYGGGVASGGARALGAGSAEDAARLDGTALGMSALLGLASTAAMLLFGRAVYAALGATGPALEAAVLYSDVLFLGAVLSGCSTPPPVSAGAATRHARRRRAPPGRRQRPPRRWSLRRGTGRMGWARRGVCLQRGDGNCCCGRSGPPARPRPTERRSCRGAVRLEVLRVSVPAAARCLPTSRSSS